MDGKGYMKCRGFTLLEIVMVLLVISVLAAALAPNVVKIMNDAREEATRKELEAIQRAIVGKPLEGQYGYVGDMGGLPASLTDLNTNPGATVYNSSHLNGIGMGWNGPYLSFGYSADDYLRDAWGNNYLYDSVSGQISSLGADGVPGTNDDLLISSVPLNIRGDISAMVTVADAGNLNVTKTLDDTEAAVWVYYANNGTEANAAARWNNSLKAFTTQDWLTHPPQGVHAVKVVGLGDYAGNEATVNAVVIRGTTSVNIFLGIFDLG